MVQSSRHCALMPVKQQQLMLMMIASEAVKEEEAAVSVESPVRMLQQQSSSAADERERVNPETQRCGDGSSDGCVGSESTRREERKAEEELVPTLSLLCRRPQTHAPRCCTIMSTALHRHNWAPSSSLLAAHFVAIDCWRRSAFTFSGAAPLCVCVCTSVCVCQIGNCLRSH